MPDPRIKNNGVGVVLRLNPGTPSRLYLKGKGFRNATTVQVGTVVVPAGNIRFKPPDILIVDFQFSGRPAATGELDVTVTVSDGSTQELPVTVYVDDGT
jgi:hypothetical protein